MDCYGITETHPAGGNTKFQGKTVQEGKNPLVHARGDATDQEENPTAINLTKYKKQSRVKTKLISQAKKQAWANLRLPLTSTKEQNSSMSLKAQRFRDKFLFSKGSWNEWPRRIHLRKKNPFYGTYLLELFELVVLLILFFLFNDRKFNTHACYDQNFSLKVHFHRWNNPRLESEEGYFQRGIIV